MVFFSYFAKFKFSQTYGRHYIKECQYIAYIKFKQIPLSYFCGNLKNKKMFEITFLEAFRKDYYKILDVTSTKK